MNATCDFLLASPLDFLVGNWLRRPQKAITLAQNIVNVQQLQTAWTAIMWLWSWAQGHVISHFFNTVVTWDSHYGIVIKQDISYFIWLPLCILYMDCITFTFTMAMKRQLCNDTYIYNLQSILLSIMCSLLQSVSTCCPVPDFCPSRAERLPK